MLQSILCIHMVLRFELRMSTSEFQAYKFEDTDQVPCIAGIDKKQLS